MATRTSSVVSMIRPITLREQVVEEIRRAIYEGRLRPGDFIREQALTQQLGVSRTPVREALIVLERDGLVVSSPNRGVSVREFSEQDIREVFAMRAALENLAAEAIITKLTAKDYEHLESLIEAQAFALKQGDLDRLGVLDQRFHEYLVSRAGNHHLTETWKAFAVQYIAVLNYRQYAYPNFDRHVMLEDHHELVEALRSGDGEHVKAVNRRFIDRVSQQCIEGVQALKRQRELAYAV